MEAGFWVREGPLDGGRDRELTESERKPHCKSLYVRGADLASAFPVTRACVDTHFYYTRRPIHIWLYILINMNAVWIIWYFLYIFWDNETQPKLFPNGFQELLHLRTKHTSQFFPLQMEK